MKNLLFLIFICSTCIAASQTTQAVYLKNGSILHGTVIYSQDSSTIRVTIMGNNTLVFPAREIDHLEKSPKSAQFPFPVYKSHGYSNLTELGFNVGDYVVPTVHTIHGYRFMDRYFAGIGTGIEFYEVKSVPFFASVRADLFKNRSTPFIFLDAGFAFPWLKASNTYYEEISDVRTGPYYAGGLGMKFNSRSGNIFTLSAGYTQANFSYKTRYLYSPLSSGQKIDMMYQRISLKFGVGF